MPDINTSDFYNNYQGINVPSLWTVDHESNGPYDTCLIASRLATFPGILPVPVASAGPTPPAFIRAHAPVQFRLVAWIVSRWGALPQLPHWDTGNANDVLIRWEIAGGSPNPSQFAAAWQRIEGIYLYCVALPNEPTTDGLALAGNLATVIPPSACNIPGAQFIRGVINPSNPAPQGPPTPTYLLTGQSGGGSSNERVIPPKILPGMPGS